MPVYKAVQRSFVQEIGSLKEFAMNDCLTTRELCAAARISRFQLNHLMRRYPDQIRPSHQVIQAYLWHKDTVGVLLSLKLKSRRAN